MFVSNHYEWQGWKMLFVNIFGFSIIKSHLVKLQNIVSKGKRCEQFCFESFQSIDVSALLISILVTTHNRLSFHKNIIGVDFLIMLFFFQF